jgi:3-ketosteroid 9alpha-monooxygenase subunit B
MKAFATPYSSYDAFVCGPAPFMKATVAALRELDFPRARRHQEKFISLGGNPFGDLHDVEVAEGEMTAADTDEQDAAEDAAAAQPQEPVTLEVELDGENYSFDDWMPGTKLLEHLESKGIKAPFSCREGECSACACRILEGEVKMLHNDVLDDEDLEEGIPWAASQSPSPTRCRSPTTDPPVVLDLRYQPRSRHSARCGRSAPIVESSPCPG